MFFAVFVRTRNESSLEEKTYSFSAILPSPLLMIVIYLFKILQLVWFLSPSCIFVSLFVTHSFSCFSFLQCPSFFFFPPPLRAAQYFPAFQHQNTVEPHLSLSSFAAVYGNTQGDTTYIFIACCQPAHSSVVFFSSFDLFFSFLYGIIVFRTCTSATLFLRFFFFPLPCSTFSSSP